MRVFQLFRSADLFLKRLAQVEDAMDELRRLVRNQDLDVSDALEKIQRLTARLAKRAERQEIVPPAPGDSAGAPDLVSAEILRRRRSVMRPKLPTEE